MNSLSLPAKYRTADQNRLLGGWRDVLDDLRQLSRSPQAVPENCECGVGSAHLRGICPCCRRATPENHVPSCRDCENLLAQLRPAIDALTVDTMRFWPVTADVVHRAALPGSVQSLREIRSAIAPVIRAFGDIIVAAGRFRDNCRTVHLNTLKQAAAALLKAASALERQL